jgi:hypothetical protein
MILSPRIPHAMQVALVAVGATLWRSRLTGSESAGGYGHPSVLYCICRCLETRNFNSHEVIVCP